MKPKGETLRTDVKANTTFGMSTNYQARSLKQLFFRKLYSLGVFFSHFTKVPSICTRFRWHEQNLPKEICQGHLADAEEP